MKKLFFCVLTIFLNFNTLKAEIPSGLINPQDKTYLSVSFGPNYCFGDTDNSKELLGPFSNQDPLQNWDVSLSYRRRFYDKFGYKALFSVDSFTGNDKSNSIPSYAFKTSMLQLSVQAEYYINFERACYCKSPNSLYVFMGVGVMGCNAKLSPNNYFPSGYIYKPTDVAPSISLGFGYLFNYSKHFAFGAEYKMVNVFSDYVDGFKPSG